MLAKLRDFANQLTFFDSVGFFDDSVLQKPNTATLFLERIQYTPLTFSRVRATGRLSIIFRVDGNGDTVLETAEGKLSQISQVLSDNFETFMLSDVQFAYVNNLKALFCYLAIEVEEG
jgi:hypothetical protein